MVIGVGLLHVVPLRGYADKLEKGIGGWLHEDRVSISSLKFSLIPSPHLKIEGLTIGKLLDAKATHGRVFVDIPALLGDRIVINSLELENVSITGDAPRRILSWGKVEGKSAAAQIDAIRLRGVKLDVKPELQALRGDARPSAATAPSSRREPLRRGQVERGRSGPARAEFDVGFRRATGSCPWARPCP